MQDTTYRQEKAIQFSAFKNVNQNPTISIRTEEGTAMFLSLNGDAKAITQQKLHGYGVTASHFGRRLNAEEAVPVTVRESVDEETGDVKSELASPAVAQKEVMKLLAL